MSDSHTDIGRAPAMCPCSNTEVRRASRKSAPWSWSVLTSSYAISMYGCFSWGANFLSGSSLTIGFAAVTGCRLPVAGGGATGATGACVVVVATGNWELVTDTEPVTGNGAGATR